MLFLNDKREFKIGCIAKNGETLLEQIRDMGIEEEIFNNEEIEQKKNDK